MAVSDDDREKLDATPELNLKPLVLDLDFSSSTLEIICQYSR
jgi:hypothetical protein